MWLDSACQDAVELFWRQAGKFEPFPRRLEGPVLHALPIAIIKLPRLRISSIERWLSHRGRPHMLGCSDRSLCGCLVAFAGNGLIFLDGTDSAAEQSFTLAHEVAHFLIDYWLPRKKAVEAFGEQICDVLDGRRGASTAERLHATLRAIRIGVQINLLERHGNSGEIHEIVQKLENRADRLALALLAPPSSVLARTRITARSFAERKSRIIATLISQFGLSEVAANAYSKSLLIAIGKGPSWTETLR